MVDAVGGTSSEAHRAGLERIVQAGAQATSVVQLLCELQRDWTRTETVQQVGEILFALEGDNYSLGNRAARRRPAKPWTLTLPSG